MRPKLDPSSGIIDQILEDDSSRPRKQHRNAKRICERLRDEYGFAAATPSSRPSSLSARTVGCLHHLCHLVHELIDARDEKRLLRLQQQLAKIKLLILDEPGFIPRSKSGAELLFEIFSQCFERCSSLVTSNLPFEDSTDVFGFERLTGALLDRLTHHIQILEMNTESYQFNQSKRR